MTVLRRLIRAAVLALAVLVPSTGHADGLAELFGGPFELLDHNGRTVSDRDFLGKPMIVMFGYTYCPSICPTDLTALAQALDDAGAAGDAVQPLFITVDPNRDTAEVLAEYVTYFHPRLIGLTGDDASVENAMKAYRIGRYFVPDTAGDPDEYLVDHTPTMFLMDAAGKFVTLFPHGTPADRIADAIKRHVNAG